MEAKGSELPKKGESLIQKDQGRQEMCPLSNKKVTSYSAQSGFIGLLGWEIKK